MLVRHVMSTEVFALRGDEPVLAALRELRGRKIRRAPLLDAEGRLIGFVTERDLLRAIPASVGEVGTSAGRAACSRPVRKVARSAVVSVDPDLHVEDLARLFLERRIGGVPVVRRGRVVGVVTEMDVFRAVVGGAHLTDADRLTVQQAQETASGSPLELAEELGLELAGMTEYPGPDGRAIVVLRVRGARKGELAEALTAAGWLLLDRRSAA